MLPYETGAGCLFRSLSAPTVIGVSSTATSEVVKNPVGSSTGKPVSINAPLSVEFFLDQSLESFLLGHVHAFQDWGGAPRIGRLQSCGFKSERWESSKARSFLVSLPRGLTPFLIP